MKTPLVPGEFAFKALIKHRLGHYWNLTDGYYFCKEEVEVHYQDFNIKWPVEEMDNGAIYCPAEEEL